MQGVTLLSASYYTLSILSISVSYSCSCPSIIHSPPSLLRPFSNSLSRSFYIILNISLFLACAFFTTPYLFLTFALPPLFSLSPTLYFVLSLTRYPALSIAFSIYFFFSLLHSFLTLSQSWVRDNTAATT